MFVTPVLFIVFNRPQETKQVFEAIRQRAPAYLYIAADGPRDNKAGEKELCEQVRQIVAAVDWPCEVKTFLREQNAGCRRAVSEAITWFFSHVEQGIILEDDCLPDASFFTYCQVLLEKYKDDESIISIGGTNLGYRFEGNHSYAFARFMNMWGWATWKRAAKMVDYNMQHWKKLPFKNLFLQKKLQRDIFKLDYNWIKFWKNYFNLTASGAMDTWDYQWIFTQLLYKKLSVFPAQNLIKNIGFSKGATHTFDPGHPVTKLMVQSMTFPLQHPSDKGADAHYEENFIKKVWFPYRKDSLYRIIRSDFLNKPVVSKAIQYFKSKNFKEGT